MAPNPTTSSHPPPKAIIFDLLTALLDSWTLWNQAASSQTLGHTWRLQYLVLTYSCGSYVPYEDLVERSAADVGLPPSAPAYLLSHWDELQPWPETVGVLRDLKARGVKLGVVTNCSTVLGRRAAGRCEVEWDAVVTAEEVGLYKPRRECYEAVLGVLGVGAEEALFVAGSAADVPGARAVGMRVFWHNRVGLGRVGGDGKDDGDGGAEREEKDLKMLVEGI